MELSEYAVERLQDDGEFVLYRGCARRLSPSSVLLRAPAAARPSPETLKKLDHEYSLRDQLDSAWAARPLALSERSSQMTLVLEDPGGATLQESLSSAMEMAPFLTAAVGIAEALGGFDDGVLLDALDRSTR